MRNTLCAVPLVLSAALGLADRAAAQPVAPPAIQSVTLQPETAVLTIAGTGLRADLVVIVDGQPVIVLPGSTATQIEVMAPATILTTPGTYRLTVVDPVRQVGDGFVVATQPSLAGPSRVALPGTQTAASGAALSPNGSMAVSPAATTVQSSPGGLTPLTVIEDSGAPYRTAIGYQALFSNTTGNANTASGYLALSSNTTGSGNTANGTAALASNTFGSNNTASGSQALVSNTSGPENTASGSQALFHNTKGSDNTANGYQALFTNTEGYYNTASGALALNLNSTGIGNTASGFQALRNNTTGFYNTATGFNALFNNTTGHANTAEGAGALFTNTTGYDNTASGMDALVSNTTGSSNTASGRSALFNNTTGTDNTANGASALALNSTGFFNTASGSQALYSNTTGATNTASGLNALYSNTTGDSNTAAGVTALFANTSGANNTAVGYGAGHDATTGSFNVFLGAYVAGTAADTNTIRIGVPYDSGTGVGQNQTFIAGIRGTQLTGSVLQVFIDANGKLGTLNPPQVLQGTGTISVSQLQQQLEVQQTTIADLRARLAKLEALLPSATGRK